ncbi:MAG: hypothetical protein ACI83N_001009 [Hydrogenophaga sp.]|jgi:hypothetical protein
MRDAVSPNTEPRSLRRRQLTALAAAAFLPGWVLAQSAPANASVLVQVWKDPNCGCCKDWMVYLEANGFRTQAFDTGNTAMRSRLGMPQKLGSCHTALVGGYVIEGHVPAREIQRLLKEKPSALGLTVPRMPIGSPGMDGPEYGGRKDPYEVLLVAKDGSTTVFQRYT